MDTENLDLLDLAAKLGLPLEDAETVEDSEDGFEQGHEEPDHAE